MSNYYTDPENWVHAYRARHTPPPSDEDDLIDWIHLQHIPSAYDTAVRLRIRALMRKHRGTSARSLAISAPEDFGKTAAVMASVLDDAFSRTPGWLEARRQHPPRQHSLGLCQRDVLAEQRLDSPSSRQFLRLPRRGQRRRSATRSGAAASAARRASHHRR